MVPFTEEDAHSIAKRLKYEYLPKGNAVRRAYNLTDKMYFILIGKVCCSFPNEETAGDLAKFHGIQNNAQAFPKAKNLSNIDEIA